LSLDPVGVPAPSTHLLDVRVSQSPEGRVLFEPIGERRLCRQLGYLRRRTPAVQADGVPLAVEARSPVEDPAIGGGAVPPRLGTRQGLPLGLPRGDPAPDGDEHGVILRVARLVSDVDREARGPKELPLPSLEGSTALAAKEPSRRHLDQPAFRATGNP